MNPAVIQALFAQVVLPEIAGWLAARRAAGQPAPTRDELLAEMNARAAVIIQAGEDFLRSKGAL